MDRDSGAGLGEAGRCLSFWDMILIMLRLPLFHKMIRREYLFYDHVRGEHVYRFYDPTEDRMYLAADSRSRFRVAFDEMEDD
jgi:hypothetical protein